MNQWGHNIRLAIFGESHGPCVGITLDGLPPGVTLDFDAIAAELARRAPGTSELSTPRRETDAPRVLSGLRDGVTTGAALCAVFDNADARSGDYDLDVPRPGHADYTAAVKYKGFADLRGGGPFSGRLTAPLVFAGAVCKQLLAFRGVTVGGRIVSIGGLTEASRWRQAILDAKAEGDSLGGVVEITASGVPVGLGEPFFRSVESVLASLLFSIPAVKGVEFGGGFALADLKGSQSNDGYRFDGGKVTLLSNHNGGILGGISNGADIEARLAIKPTPTIGREQPGVNLRTGEDVLTRGRGRHDPCIVPRAVPAAEAALALTLLDLWP